MNSKSSSADQTSSAPWPNGQPNQSSTPAKPASTHPIADNDQPVPIDQNQKVVGGWSFND
ncbi:MAG: hypothetical protein Q8P32_04020 [Candidatus Komeilibacteria bacterium]|nr:hypothetical protein [Candidatus Komeilibacteria bacterium]